MLARVAVPDQFQGTSIEVLLGAADTFLEGWGCRLIQDLDAAARTFGDVHLIQPCVFVPSAWCNDPYLSGRQGIAANAVLAVQLGRGDELLHPFLSHGVTELSVTKFSGADAFLLFFNAATALQRDAQGPFQHLIRNCRIRIWRYELDESAHGLLDARRVATAQCTAQVDAPLKDILPTLTSQLVPAFGEEVADKPKVIG